MLRLPPFRYLAPGTIEQAVAMLAGEGEQAMLVAGGTDLYPNMKRRQFTPPVLIGLRGIAALKSIDGSPEQGMRIGAGVTLTTLAEHPLIQQHYPALATASAAVSTPQLRNAGTIGGNVLLLGHLLSRYRAGACHPGCPGAPGQCARRTCDPGAPALPGRWHAPIYES